MPGCRPEYLDLCRRFDGSGAVESAVGCGQGRPRQCRGQPLLVGNREEPPLDTDPGPTEPELDQQLNQDRERIVLELHVRADVADPGILPYLSCLGQTHERHGIPFPRHDGHAQALGNDLMREDQRVSDVGEILPRHSHRDIQTVVADRCLQCGDTGTGRSHFTVTPSSLLTSVGPRVW